jgi:hypothetical protein
MGRNIQEVSLLIDNLAKQGCRLLDREEKERFFEQSKCKRYYVKGKNKGKERDIYEVNGKCFNDIWKLITPYVFISCNKSVYYNSSEVEDAVAEVKYMLFYVLQRFGPVFNGQTLSQRLGIIVNMSLTNRSNKKAKEIKTISYDTGCTENEENIAVEPEDTNHNMKYIDFWCDVPKKMEECVVRILSGCSITETQKYFNNNRIKPELISFTSKMM